MERIRAAYPLAEYENRIACVVSADLFTEDDYATIIFHEFVHCYQYATCEHDLKLQLQLADVMDDPMWELNYPFPYQDRLVIERYQHWLEALVNNQAEEIQQARFLLATHLAPDMWDYMVWQEWKEGFARWIEQQVRQRLGLVLGANTFPHPFSRSAFYTGGAAFIAWLTQQKPALAHNLPALFEHIQQMKLL